MINREPLVTGKTRAKAALNKTIRQPRLVSLPEDIGLISARTEFHAVARLR